MCQSPLAEEHPEKILVEVAFMALCNEEKHTMETHQGLRVMELELSGTPAYVMWLRSRFQEAGICNGLHAVRK